MSEVKKFEGKWATIEIDGLNIYQKSLQLEAENQQLRRFIADNSMDPCRMSADNFKFWETCHKEFYPQNYLPEHWRMG